MGEDAPDSLGKEGIGRGGKGREGKGEARQGKNNRVSYPLVAQFSIYLLTNFSEIGQ